ncbi:MAG TPA: MazG-like family protein [Candidatus Saccharimonadales bacterium]|jgi:NTP pyrophosphatase (non-canonical NTP hydrolase)
MGDFDELQKLIVKFRDDRNWRQFHNPKDLAISLLLEAAELLEHFQWKNPEEMRRHIVKHKQEVSEELADVLYWVLLIGNDLEIDLTDALKKKMVQNGAKYPVSKSKGNYKKYIELAKE